MKNLEKELKQIMKAQRMAKEVALSCADLGDKVRFFRLEKSLFKVAHNLRLQIFEVEDMCRLHNGL